MDKAEMKILHWNEKNPTFILSIIRPGVVQAEIFRGFIHILPPMLLVGFYSSFQSWNTEIKHFFSVPDLVSLSTFWILPMASMRLTARPKPWFLTENTVNQESKSWFCSSD